MGVALWRAPVPVVRRLCERRGEVDCVKFEKGLIELKSKISKSLIYTKLTRTTRWKHKFYDSNLAGPLRLHAVNLLARRQLNFRFSRRHPGHLNMIYMSSCFLQTDIIFFCSWLTLTYFSYFWQNGTGNTLTVKTANQSFMQMSLLPEPKFEILFTKSRYTVLPLLLFYLTPTGWQEDKLQIYECFSISFSQFSDERLTVYDFLLPSLICFYCFIMLFPYSYSSSPLFYFTSEM